METRSSCPAPELLEVRIAPASAFVFYTDVDGDLVKITASRPGAGAPPLDETDLAFIDGNTEGQLGILNVSAEEFDGASIVFKVTKKPGGDGLAHVGYIDATGRDLDRVVVKGDLDRINAGDSTTANDPAIGLLQARSMGTFGLATQGGSGSLNSTITGRLGALRVAGHMMDAYINVVGPTAADASIGSVFIGGDLVGGDALNSGRVASGGPITTAFIGGSILGGDGAGTGQLYSSTDILKVRIGGDLIGGAGIYSGQLAAVFTLGDAHIAGRVMGGAGQESGLVFNGVTIEKIRIGGGVHGGGSSLSGTVYSNGEIISLRIDGDVIGGAGTFSGSIVAKGGIGSASIAGDVVGGSASASGAVYSEGKTGNLNIGGDMLGGAGTFSGTVFSNGDLGTLKIRGNMLGGSNTSSGTVDCRGAITSVSIAGDAVGGAGTTSGVIFGQLGIFTIKIGGDFRGGSGEASGQIRSIASGLGDITIGGDLVGGTANNTGLISTDRTITSVRVGGNIIGSSVAGSASLNFGGAIYAFSRIFSVTIGGSIIAGSDASSGTLEHSGAIVAGRDLGPVKIGGSLIGDPTNPALISARGQVSVFAEEDIAITSISIGGDVRWARILAGFDTTQAPINADACIGPVKVGRDWIASSLVAGARDSGADGFGKNDALQLGGDPELTARIASIWIKGNASGSARFNDHFGFVAQQIDKLRIGARVFILAPGPSNDSLAIPHLADVRLLEV